MALPSVFTVASAVVVVVAGVGLAVSGTANAGTPDRGAAHSATATPPSGGDIPAKDRAHHHPGSKRHRHSHHAVPKALVEIYNNAGITGLAAAKADLLQGAGWKVAGADNWYGDIPANTVYYPPGLRRAADRLATVLGVQRLRPAVAPMMFDRLTVIFTTQ
jgi:LytR cell envelope-related transcriptional attenuator